MTVIDALVVPGSYSRIQDAIDAAASGGTIVVLPGTYRENLRIQGKTIVLTSTNPSDVDVVRSTIVVGSEYGRPTVNFGGDSYATMSGFTIMPGQAGEENAAQCGACGGSIYIREASPYIKNNRIINATDAGIAIYESAAHIENNVFQNCSSVLPGGAISIDSYRRAPTVIGNIFEGNKAPSGGAIFITAGLPAANAEASSAAATTVKDNEFRNNTATQFGGGAIFVEYYGRLLVTSPDSNKYVGNSPNDIVRTIPH